MKRAKQIEDLDIWMRAREICKLVYKLYRTSDLKKDPILYDQINKSSGSIMDNIAEGFERNGNREFIQFLSISKASCGELRSQLYRGLDRGYYDNRISNELNFKCTLLSQKISALMSYLLNSSLKGTKYRNR